MSILIITIHVVVSLALIMIVLLQTGKGADMGAAFGGGSSQTLFGSSGASTFLSKATTVAAIIFMLTCFTLAYMSTHKTSKSIMKEEKVPTKQEEKVPAEPKTAEIPSESQESTKAVEPSEAAGKTATETQDVEQMAQPDTKKPETDEPTNTPATENNN